MAASGKYSGASPFLQSARGIKGLSSDGFKTKMDFIREREREEERPDTPTAILEYLKQHDGSTSEAMEKELELPPSEVSSAVAMLTEEGFIESVEIDGGEKGLKILPAGERKLRYRKKARF